MGRRDGEGRRIGLGRGKDIDTRGLTSKVCCGRDCFDTRQPTEKTIETRQKIQKKKDMLNAAIKKNKLS